MLELIVLGQVPGTDFRLTFFQVAMLFVAGAIGLFGIQELHNRRHRPAADNSEIEDTAI